MGNFIWKGIKLVIIYFIFYFIGVVVFGATACMGCTAVIKSLADDARQEEAAKVIASPPAPAATATPVKTPAKKKK